MAYTPQITEEKTTSTYHKQRFMLNKANVYGSNRRIQNHITKGYDGLYQVNLALSGSVGPGHIKVSPIPKQRHVVHNVHNVY